MGVQHNTPCRGRDEMTRTGLRKCGLESATGIAKMGGELVAYSYKQKKTGYKAPNAYGARPVFQGVTTNKEFQGQVRVVGENSNTEKKLAPYHPNASRNRPKETMENVVGRKYQPPITCKTETYRGMSHITIKDGDPDSTRPWKTTNQVFAECTAVQNTTGLGNPGIASDVAIATHKKQGIYS
uniref:Uncharacterized protein n=1 Tax=Tetraselmis sp. GSL018 TaxID=582737 RepID=A0A061SFA7_9CHLO|mmetsp:Transcript_20562/g.48969  ORF Transcript_20562/g.48969 Transcript_20562/m.48969 type:complete len:183 (-) Transcript_20562:90-638(-)|eukprot:CAMPEP_0177585378 /NCGR_PEP_ID=MMETSP0419_2-20121207/4458_1 /TAXON_ID=582737 /ORGANISM="Tetraselmis sp., Strain GSL018" /LENGTH=182 /DNA_ID=CAMNT_0019075101 /DNA_START=94 /DNA_END=642 /DNA_ORIENTATION=-